MLGPRGCRLGIMKPGALPDAGPGASSRRRIARKHAGGDPHVEIMIPLIGHRAGARARSSDWVRDVADDGHGRRAGSACRLPRRHDDRDAARRARRRRDRRRRRVLLVRHERPHADDVRLLARRRRGPLPVASTSSASCCPRTRSRPSTATASAQLVRIGVRDGAGRRGPDSSSASAASTAATPRRSQFCHEIGLDYVSCSPYRVPLARLAAAHAALGAGGPGRLPDRRASGAESVLALVDATCCGRTPRRRSQCPVALHGCHTPAVGWARDRTGAIRATAHRGSRGRGSGCGRPTPTPTRWGRRWARCCGRGRSASDRSMLSLAPGATRPVGAGDARCPEEAGSVPALLRARSRPGEALAAVAAAGGEVPGVRRPRGRPSAHPADPRGRGRPGGDGHRPGRQPVPAADRGDRTGARLRARPGRARIGGGVLAVSAGRLRPCGLRRRRHARAAEPLPRDARRGAQPLVAPAAAVDARRRGRRLGRPHRVRLPRLRGRGARRDPRARRPARRGARRRRSRSRPTRSGRSCSRCSTRSTAPATSG